MALRRCDNGHYYDENKYSSCPSCGIRDLNVEATRPMRPSPRSDAPAESPEAFLTRRKNDQRPEPEPGVTRAYWHDRLGIDPVVGWLVCVEGPDKGRDYRIRSERNQIGRDSSMGICISGDESISREKHAVISFNPKKNSFLLAPGGGRGLAYLNDDEVAIPAELKSYDVIELGKTKLIFVPFCCERFQWSSDA